MRAPNPDPTLDVLEQASAKVSSSFDVQMFRAVVTPGTLEIGEQYMALLREAVTHARNGHVDACATCLRAAEPLALRLYQGFLKMVQLHIAGDLARAGQTRGDA